MPDASLALPLALVAAFTAGAGLAWLVATWHHGRRVARLRLEAGERTAASEAALARERSRREELEGEVAELRRVGADLDRRLAVAEERAARGRELAEEQRRFAGEAIAELERSFRGLASSALEGANRQLLTLAEERFKAREGEMAARLGEREAAIRAALEPLREAVDRLGERGEAMESARASAHGRIDRQVRLLAEAAAALDERTASLTAALRGSPHARGRWGEVALRNVVELAGMSEHCDFAEQVGLDGGGRPDLVVRLPGGRAVAVDAKAPVRAYLAALEAVRREERSDALGRYARELRAHVGRLAARDYAAQLDRGVDLVVLFLPADPFLGAALEAEPGLQEEALAAGVLLATPTTLIALLRTLALHWRERAVAENAVAIAAAARELLARAEKLGGELAGVGRGLSAAVAAYNRAVGSFERRLLPMGRRLEELGAAAPGEALEAPDGVEREVRSPAGPADGG